MSPLLDSRSHGLRTVRNPLISGALQQCGKKFLVEADSHNRAGPSPDWGPPKSRTRQLPEVVTGLSLICPGLDLLVAHATSVDKMLAHGNIVYETRSWSLPLPPQHSTARHHHGMRRRLRPLMVRRCFWTAPSSRPSLSRRPRSAGRRTCNRRSRAVSRWVPSLGAARASPSSWPSTARASWCSSPARDSRWWRLPEREYLTDADFVTAPYRTARYQVACRVREDRCVPSSPGCRRRLTNTRARLDYANRWADAR